MEKIRTALRFDGLICVDYSGRFRSGGLAPLWISSSDVTLQSCSLNHIDVTIVDSTQMKLGDLQVSMVFLMNLIEPKHGTCSVSYAHSLLFLGYAQVILMKSFSMCRKKEECLKA